MVLCYFMFLRMSPITPVDNKKPTGNTWYFGSPSYIHLRKIPTSWTWWKRLFKEEYTVYPETLFEVLILICPKIYICTLPPGYDNTAHVPHLNLAKWLRHPIQFHNNGIHFTYQPAYIQQQMMAWSSTILHLVDDILTMLLIKCFYPSVLKGNLINQFIQPISVIANSHGLNGKKIPAIETQPPRLHAVAGSFSGWLIQVEHPQHIQTSSNGWVAAIP